MSLSAESGRVGLPLVNTSSNIAPSDEGATRTIESIADQNVHDVNDLLTTEGTYLQEEGIELNAEPIQDNFDEPEATELPEDSPASIDFELSPALEAEPDPPVESEIQTEVKPDVTVPEEPSATNDFSTPPLSMFFRRVTSFFPLAQQSIVEPIIDTEIVNESSEVTEVTQSVVDESDVNQVVSSSVTPDPTVLNANIEQAVEIGDVEMIEDDILEMNISLDTLNESVGERETIPKDNNRITLKDFGLPDLHPGQIIEGIQLRLSLAGSYVQPTPDTPLPFLRVDYRIGSLSGSAGSIIVDGELSNAMNGGYYLIALPTLTNPTLLRDLEITLSYEGETTGLESLMIDAVWVEVHTSFYDKKALRDRIAQLKLKHLQAPEVSELLNSQVNYRRNELPLFNLRYESQRNFIIRTARSLFGRDLAVVEEVELVHRNLGNIGITPEINVTGDGLITIKVKEADKDRLRPGEYTVEIMIDEGGKEYRESFSFQWGMLSLNPRQSEYVVGEMVTVDFGALSPNGNTVCDATLDLYITAPDDSVQLVPVIPSGLCNGNNVIDVPDYSAEFLTAVSGEYELYLERLDEMGEVIAFTTDSVQVADEQRYTLARSGPTRIYPLAPYNMDLVLSTQSEGFSGTITERVPASFEIISTDAVVETRNGYHELTWETSLFASSSRTFSYEFDAPDISPYLFLLGPATLNEDESNYSFTEHRSWQIASDAVGSMLLLWDDGVTIPGGWTCVSCLVSDSFYQRFIVGSSTAGINGGALTHNHNASYTILETANTVSVGGNGPSNYAELAHAHGNTLTIQNASNTPAYRNLVIIQHNSAGEPTTLPAGAIAIFDGSLPSGWSQYSAQNGRYVRGDNQASVTNTGGSNTHTNPVTGTLTGSTGTAQANTAGAIQISNNGHTHTVDDALDADSNEPPYIEVILAELGSSAPPPNGMIGMWTEDADGGWDVVSGSGQPFENRFFKASTTYGTTGGSATHTPANQSVISGAGVGTTARGGTGQTRPAGAHTHTINLTAISSANHLPLFRTAVFAKRVGLDPIFTQSNYRWYVNQNAQTPTDPWSTGGFDVDENEPITGDVVPVKSGEVVRLRINAEGGNATTTTGTLVKLQYASAPVCSGASGWTDVGTAGSGAIWRGFNNASVADGGTLSSTTLASSTVALTYEENGASTATPAEVPVGGYGEWDFVLQNNGADNGTEYCFRLVYDDDSTFLTYDNYPQLITNSAPNEYTLRKRFDNENTPETLPTFDFFAVDPENDKVEYQIQIASDYNFSSVDVDRTTISNSTQFENQVLTSEKNPFTSGQLIRFTNNTALDNGTTYWWRIRAIDPSGSNEYGEWSEQDSFTVTTSLLATGWLQLQDEQFDRGSLVGTEVYGSDEVRLITGSSTGTITSPTIDFSQADSGTAWGAFRFTDNTTNGSISYQIEYRNEDGEWNLVSNADLAGNSSGFTSSPISLLGLDVDTYRFFRLKATLNNSGGTPYLESWAVDWGFRVETPTIDSPFTNEKVGTTTPTFVFVASDPNNSGLTYQIEWSTDNTFSSGVTTRTSTTTDTVSFINLDDSGNYDPFTSGETIAFTIQSADALTNGTTYWWRVRAKDTTGDDEYSFWTPVRSFTVDNTIVTSTWFQTTEEQFRTNVLSGAVGVTGGVTVATVAQEAIIVYGEGTVTTPRYRIWDGGNWSSEASLQNINSTVRWVVTRAATTREEYVAGTIGANGHVIAQVYALGEWGSQQTMTTSVGSAATRGFDIAYESTSGDAIIVYCDGDANPSYRVWNGSTWSTEVSITSALTSNCRWVEMASDPTTDEIVLVLRGVNDTPYQALVWNATTETWGNSTTLGTARVATYSGIGVMYEESGDQAVVTAPSAGGGPNRMVYRTWNGTTWSAETTQTIGGRLYWGSFARNVGSDELMFCYVNDNTEVRAIRWTGAAFANDTQFTATVNSSADPAYGCEFENGSSRNNYVVGTYSDTTQTNFRTWDTTAWSGATQVNTIGRAATMQLVRTGNNLILGVFNDYLNTSLRFAAWNSASTSWTSTQTLEDSVSVTTSPYGYPYWMATRNPASSGTVVVAPAIEFTEGLGPYWDEFLWSETTPGTSEVVYQLQYYSTTTEAWQFITNADLSGNEIGFTAGPIDLSGLSVATYGTIRPYASLSCDGSSNCPTINDWTVTWAEGITVSGTAQAYDRSTDVTSGTVAVAVNGVLQTGKTGAITAGAWSIDNVTVFDDDIVTIFVTGAADANEAVGVTIYDGAGDITGIKLYEQHLSLGSDDAPVFTNTLLDSYTNSNNADIFYEVTSNVLTLCVKSGCAQSRLIVLPGTTYQPGAALTVYDFVNHGTFTLGATTMTVNGSWTDTATSTLTGSTVIMGALTGSHTITPNSAFNTLTLATTTSSAVWTLATPLSVNGVFTVTSGTLSRGTQPITLQSNLITGTSGVWAGIGTTTFVGTGNSFWNDQNSAKQNVGNVVVDGTSKSVTLQGNVSAQSILIGANDSLDASTSNYSITVYGDWVNTNVFTPRTGTVIFAATTTNQTITRGTSNFANLTFNGAGGSWSFTEPTLNVNQSFSIATGTVTLPTATTTIGGSFLNTGGAFAHNNSIVNFTGSGANTLTLGGTTFTNAFYDVRFSGTGSWTFSEVNATTTNDMTITAGTVTFPNGTLAMGGSFVKSAGNFNGSNGTLEFFGAGSETVRGGGSSFNSLSFVGGGTYTIDEANTTALGSVSIVSGSLTLPTTLLTVGGSFTNNDSFSAGSGEVRFTSTATGQTINAGDSNFYDLTINSATGGWTITNSATTTNNFTLTNANDFTLDSGQTLRVEGLFSNSVGSTTTDWTGSTLVLSGPDHSINAKTDAGDVYGTLNVEAGTQIAVWNSEATSYSIAGSLYSQDHTGSNGALAIFGNYQKTNGAEYWSYATDFDGADLTGVERPVIVSFASGATATLSSSTVGILGTASATTTITNQGSGTYTIAVDGGAFTAEYYDFSNLGSTGLSLLGGVTVATFDNGAFTPAIASGAGITLSSTTIDANPAKQIFNVHFATTTAISAFNVAQTDGAPASFWWFRNGTGNLYGETFDNDTGDPGSIRFDDSSLTITVSGTVYGDAGITPLSTPTCDNSTLSVRIVVSGGGTYNGSCSSTDGSYSIGGVVVIGDPTLTTFLNTNGGVQAVAVTKTPTADISDMDLYANRLIVRHEDTSPLTIEDLALFDADNDSDVRFIATTSSENSLILPSNTELYIWPNKTFSPGGAVTLLGNAESNSYDGTLYVASDATFVGYASSTITLGGRLELATDATFSPASTTVVMNATTTGKSITAPQEITLHELIFDGVGGGWNLTADIVANDDVLVNNGTVTGTADITIPNGSFFGNGAVTLGTGTTLIGSSNTLGGTTPWTFASLTLGSGSTVGTTTPVFSTTTILGTLTVSSAHYFDAGSSFINLNGSGTVFVENGTFLEDTSTVRYSGNSANVLDTTYYNLSLDAAAGTPTYTATGVGILVQNDLVVGGTAPSVFNVTTNDPLLSVRGDVLITSNGTLVASDTDELLVGGDWTNNGTFTANGGTVVFDTDTSTVIDPGSSSFASVLIDGAGTFTVFENATATVAWRLLNHTNFTLASGRTMAVGGVFENVLGDNATTWTGSTLALYGGGNYTINASTTADEYATLSVRDTTQIRAWNTDATVFDVASTASLYSQDHAGAGGELYIFGSYTKASGTDNWSYATDFDGTNITGSERIAEVYIAGGGSVSYAGGSLTAIGDAGATTTIQNQGSGTYAFAFGTGGSLNWDRVQVRDADVSGVVLSGTPSVVDFSRTDHLVTIAGGSALSVGGTVITANPAKNFNGNSFATSTGLTSAYNVTATGTSISSWRFTNHIGTLSGELYDSDPGGDPGYVVWDNSAALITISGDVYSDEGITVSTICNISNNNITLQRNLTNTYTTFCDPADGGKYEFTNVPYSPTDTLVVYISGVSQKAANVIVDPVTSVLNADLYENRVIVRHENTTPVSIADMAVFDSSDDADVPYTAIVGSPSTLTLPANRKLIVWTGKTFAPGGNVTLSGGGAGAAYDGTFEAQADATFTAVGTEVHSIGGSFIFGSSALFNAAQSTTTFTTTGSARTIAVNESAFYNIAFTGSGSWNISDPTLTVSRSLSQSSGSLTFPTGTTTIGASMNVTGGSFDINESPLLLTSATAGNVVRFNNSPVAELAFTGIGSWTMSDANATSTGNVTIESGTVTLPSGSFAISQSFINESTINHNSGELRLLATTTAELTAGASDLFRVRFADSGMFTMTDTNLTILDDLLITNGADVTLASGTLSVAGSFVASSGTFDNASGTILFIAAASGKTIDPGISEFHDVVIGAPSGGYTMSSATTTNLFTLSTVNNFTLSPGETLAVGGLFLNTAGGASTTWTNSTLRLNAESEYSINERLDNGDVYGTLVIGDNSDVRSWYSAAATTTVSGSSSYYAQDYNNTDGLLHIYGDLTLGTTTEYWSFSRDFDGTTLVGIERPVTVAFAPHATTTLVSGTLEILGATGNETTIENQGSGTYSLSVLGGTLNAQYYSFEDLDIFGLQLYRTPTITNLSNGYFELAVDTGALITVSSTTVNANPSKTFAGVGFNAVGPLTGVNVELIGETDNAWRFQTEYGNIAGEDFDIDGVDACGSIRWSDSNCLLTELTQYRWRNDDGGEGAPNSEWFDLDWDYRERIKVVNADASTYTEPVIFFTLPYDSSMSSDFADLRFTTTDGVTEIPYWIERVDAGVEADVWVQLPSLPSSDTATAFMYYGNNSAFTTSSSTTTFIASDDFEANSLSPYSGDTTLFSVGTSPVFGGEYALKASNPSGKTINGMFRFDQVLSQNQTIRYRQYVDITAGSGDEACTLFGVQSPGTTNQNYAVCLELFGVDRISLAKNVENNDTSGTVLATSTVTYATGWYDVTIDWLSGGAINVALRNSAGALVASVSATDTDYSSGGFGYAFWFQNGAWDSFTVRPYIVSEPTIQFGAKQPNGGATWLAGPDTPLPGTVPNETIRLRIVVENSGLEITGQEFRLDYAPKGVAPTCQSVSTGDYVAVPPQASCGTSPVCMQTSTNVNDNDPTTDLFFNTSGLFVPGRIVTSPSNLTSSSSIDQNEYTEIEYVLVTTINASDSAYCFRVTNDGADLDFYDAIPELAIAFDPIIGFVSLNGGDNISLLPGATTTVYATATVTDLNGYQDLTFATSTLYRSGVGPMCSANENNCYISSVENELCAFTSCSGSSCVLECRADIYYHADPTDDGSFFEGESWLVYMEVEDASGGYDIETLPIEVVIEVNSLSALTVNESINYGELIPDQDSGSYNATTTIINLGNIGFDIAIDATDLLSNYSTSIAANFQKFATSTFEYSACSASSCFNASSSASVFVPLGIPKPTTPAPFVEESLYWGIFIPFGTAATAHQGVNTFYPIPY